jgi:Papain family cysteine protease
MASTSTKPHLPSTSAAGTRRILNCVPSQNTEKDWLLRHAAEAGVLAAAPAVPPAKDLRETWWTIGDQGATGSCVGWGTAEGVLRWHFVKAKKLDTASTMSPRFIWMAAKETDADTAQPTTFIESDGTTLKAALDVARKFGSVTDTVLPFKGGTLYTGEVPTFYAISTQRKIASYFNLGTNLADWRKWIANHGPILTRLDVDATWDAATETKGKLAKYQPSTTRGGHCVALVGYTTTGFIVRNSWGTSWGDQGFAYPSNAYASKAFTEAYGVAL